MTDVYIADANILFDLFDIDLFKTFTALELNVHISQFVINEIENPEQREQIESCDSISVRYFDSAELEDIHIIERDICGLSFEDCSILLMR